VQLSREDVQRDHIEATYDWRRHVAALGLTAASVGAFAFAKLRTPRGADWLIPIGTFLLCNGGEYWIHRGPFHHPFPGWLRGLYHRHTTLHHAMFSHERMECDDPRDLKWTLLPAWGYAAIVGVTSPLAVALRRVSPNAPWLFLLSMTGYYALYEILHTAAHLPESHALTRHPLIRAVTSHHRRHHDPRRMAHLNFNFALPLFDWLHGTWQRGRVVQADLA
jgi:hypothetical protein